MPSPRSIANSCCATRPSAREIPLHSLEAHSCRVLARWPKPNEHPLVTVLLIYKRKGGPIKALVCVIQIQVHTHIAMNRPPHKNYRLARALSLCDSHAPISGGRKAKAILNEFTHASEVEASSLPTNPLLKGEKRVRVKAREPSRLRPYLAAFVGLSVVGGVVGGVVASGGGSNPPVSRPPGPPPSPPPSPPSSSPVFASPWPPTSPGRAVVAVDVVVEQPVVVWNEAAFTNANDVFFAAVAQALQAATPLLSNVTVRLEETTIQRSVGGERRRLVNVWAAWRNRANNTL